MLTPDIHPTAPLLGRWQEGAGASVQDRQRAGALQVCKVARDMKGVVCWIRARHHVILLADKV